MGTVIKDQDTTKFAPTAQLQTAGASLTGVLVGKKERKTKWGMRPLYSVKVTDADCKFMKGDAEVFPNAGEDVEFFAPTRLARQLDQVPMNSNVVIRYLGKKETGGANPAHAFHVEII